MGLDGSSPETVERALAERDPLPGTRGFAGRLDGGLVRDVLGRYPLYSERGDPDAWAFDTTDLDDPDPVPAGHRRTAGGDERIWSLPDPDPLEAGSAVQAVRSAIDRSFDDVPAGETDVAVAFSGGVDSALVAAGLPDAPLYVAGFTGSHDVAAARESAAATDRDLRVVEVTHDDIRRAVPEVVAATGRTNAMDLGIALPLFLVAERAAADGHDALAVGQGADELFGGYAKVASASDDPRVEADTVRGATREVIDSLPDQLPRDVLALRAAGVEPVAPLLHDAVVGAALALPAGMLVDGDTRKVALRRAARAWVPDDVAARDKKAVQYGSLVARELDRLARRNGFKRRMDDHVRKYVESIVE